MQDKTKQGDWPELAMGLYDRLTGRGAEISYDMQNVEVMVPSAIGPDATQTKWVVNGTVTISTRDRAAN